MRNNEVLTILMEECAEVIQASSKCIRFGLESTFNNLSCKQRLMEEIGDLLAMIDVLEEQDIIDLDIVEEFKQEKFKKLTIWSNITFKGVTK